MIKFSAGVKRFLPKSLLGRSLLILVVPILLVQTMSAVIFFENHWSKISLRLARDVAGEIAYVVNATREDRSGEHAAKIYAQANAYFGIRVNFVSDAVLQNKFTSSGDIIDEVLERAMRERVGRPFQFLPNVDGRNIRISVQLADGVMEVTTTRKRLFSSTAYVFIIWMVGLSLLLFGVAIIFMRNQVRPIRKLAQAADDFGRGRDSPGFKPEGAQEVRRAARAFMLMRGRLDRQIRQRTEMLAGVSHDLRTPLTRMKLQLAMMENNESTQALQADILDMEHMLEEYLAFARGAGSEKAIETELGGLLREVVDRARGSDAQIDLHLEGDIVLALRPNAMKRCLTNLILNAARHGTHVSVRGGRRDNRIEIIIDDDGPGIPLDQRDDVFKPFFRIDKSRNSETGGVGLGMTIARDAVRSHGGDILLEDAPGGGLRVRVRVPL